MKKMTFGEIRSLFNKHNSDNGITQQFADKTPLRAVVVFTPKGWVSGLTEEELSWVIRSDNKFFLGTAGSSLYADCLDGSEHAVRLDYVLNCDHKVAYCYLLEQ